MPTSRGAYLTRPSHPSSSSPGAPYSRGERASDTAGEMRGHRTEMEPVFYAPSGRPLVAWWFWGGSSPPTREQRAGGVGCQANISYRRAPAGITYSHLVAVAGGGDILLKISTPIKWCSSMGLAPWVRRLMSRTGKVLRADILSTP